MLMLEIFQIMDRLLLVVELIAGRSGHWRRSTRSVRPSRGGRTFNDHLPTIFPGGEYWPTTYTAWVDPFPRAHPKPAVCDPAHTIYSNYIHKVSDFCKKNVINANGRLLCLRTKIFYIWARLYAKFYLIFYILKSDVFSFCFYHISLAAKD